MEFGALLGGGGGGGGGGGVGVGAAVGEGASGMSRADARSSIYAPNTQNASTLNPWLIGTIVVAIILGIVLIVRRRI